MSLHEATIFILIACFTLSAFFVIRTIFIFLEIQSWKRNAREFNKKLGE